MRGALSHTPALVEQHAAVLVVSAAARAWEDESVPVAADDEDEDEDVAASIMLSHGLKSSVMSEPVSPLMFVLAFDVVPLPLFALFVARPVVEADEPSIPSISMCWLRSVSASMFSPNIQIFNDFI